MKKKNDHGKVIHMTPIEISKQFWADYGYAMITLEHACEEIKTKKDIGAHNEIVMCISHVLGALYEALYTDDMTPINETPA